MSFNKLKVSCLSASIIDHNEEIQQSQFKNFSAEFVKLYQDIEDDNHLFVGAVCYFNTPF